MWASGNTLGPVIGGILSHPADRWPATFAKLTFFSDFPYFLPCFVAGLVPLSAFFLSAMFLKEVSYFASHYMWLIVLFCDIDFTFCCQVQERRRSFFRARRRPTVPEQWNHRQAATSTSCAHDENRFDPADQLRLPSLRRTSLQCVDPAGMGNIHPIRRPRLQQLHHRYDPQHTWHRERLRVGAVFPVVIAQSWNLEIVHGSVWEQPRHPRRVSFDQLFGQTGWTHRWVCVVRIDGANVRIYIGVHDIRWAIPRGMGGSVI